MGAPVIMVQQIQRAVQQCGRRNATASHPACQQDSRTAGQQHKKTPNYRPETPPASCPKK